jgi:hypothetical protein
MLFKPLILYLQYGQYLTAALGLGILEHVRFVLRDAKLAA